MNRQQHPQHHDSKAQILQERFRFRQGLVHHLVQFRWNLACAIQLVFCVGVAAKFQPNVSSIAAISRAESLSVLFPCAKIQNTSVVCAIMRALKHSKTANTNKHNLHA